MDLKIYENIMNNPPIIDKEYLANALRLRITQISNIDIYQVIESNTALVIKLKVLIKENNNIDSTIQLFIKTLKYKSENNNYNDLSINEAEFYKLIQCETKEKLPIAQCFDAYISEDGSKYILLLEDLSNEFDSSDKVNLSSESVWLSAASSLAKFHATFWNSDKIGSSDLPIDDIEKINIYIKNTYESYDKFIKYVGNRFDNETLAIYEHALKISVGLETERYNRLTNKDNITLKHGDSHIHNFMFPHNQNETTIIIDFQFWGMGIGVGDVAHLTRESLPESYGEKFHRSIIENYYETLLVNDVCNYSWDTCWNDYRKQVASMLLIPMWQYTCFNIEYDNWAKDVSTLILNYKVLNCQQLIGSESI